MPSYTSHIEPRSEAMTDNAELRTLISAKLWPAVVERVRSHQHEVGSSSSLRNQGGYTVLHAIATCHVESDMDGRELVPVVRAILRAADEIDYAAAFGPGGARGDGAAEAVDGRGIGNDETTPAEDAGRGGGGADGTGGSWRLLMDQSNRASWSPLHLV